MSSRRETVLVTGATGFVGWHTAAALRREGRRVRALVRDASKGARVLEPLGIAGEDRVVGDMTDAAAVASAIGGCDGVVHAAAGVSVTGGAVGGDANLEGTRAVIGAAVERGLDTVFVSSLVAMFDWKRPITDDSPLVASRTEYGRSKMACDAWVRERQAEGAPVAIVYPPGVVGPDDPGFSESVKAYRSFLRGTLASSGGNQLVDVRDLALLIVRMLDRAARGRVVAAGHYFDWDDFTALIEGTTGATISRIRAPAPLLRGFARTLDVIGRATGRKMPMSGEGIEIATRWPVVDDSPRVTEYGVTWRPAEETIADLFRWLVEAGRLPATAVPALATSPDSD